MSDQIHLAIRGENNSLRHQDCDFDNVRLDIIGNDNRITFGRYARLRDTTLRLRGSGHRLHIGGSCEIEALHLRLLQGGGVFALGPHSFVLGMDASVFEGTRCVIGRDCLISRGVVLATGDAHPIMDAATGKRINPSADVIVGDHVWLGLETLLLKGAQVGRGSVVGARAVVTGTLPEGTLAAGNPARVLREGITWHRDFAGADAPDEISTGQNPNPALVPAH